MSGEVLARLIRSHDPSQDWHQWVTLDERIKADRLGRPNPHMYQANWIEWRCNNMNCWARAIVSDANSLLAIEEAESSV